MITNSALMSPAICSEGKDGAPVSREESFGVARVVGDGAGIHRLIFPSSLMGVKIL